MSFCPHTYMCGHIFFNSLGYILRNGITGSHGNSTLNILRKCQTIFQKTSPFYIVTSNEDSNISTSSSILVIFFIVALVGVKWYPTVILIHSFNFIIGQLDKTKLKNILKCLNSLFFKFKQNDSKLVLFSFKFCIGFFSAFR